MNLALAANASSATGRILLTSRKCATIAAHT